MDEESKGEHREGAREGAHLSVSQVPIGRRHVVHTLPLAIRLLPLRRPAGRSVLPPGAVLSVSGCRTNAGQGQGMQGKGETG